MFVLKFLCQSLPVPKLVYPGPFTHFLDILDQAVIKKFENLERGPFKRLGLQIKPDLDDVKSVHRIVPYLKFLAYILFAPLTVQ